MRGDQPDPMLDRALVDGKWKTSIACQGCDLRTPTAVGPSLAELFFCHQQDIINETLQEVNAGPALQDRLPRLEGAVRTRLSVLTVRTGSIWFGMAGAAPRRPSIGQHSARFRE
jgi:hypothetical protein